MPRRSRLSVGSLVLALAMIGGGYWAWRAARATTPVSFRTVRVDKGAVESSVTATGAINAVVTVQVGSQVSGTIAKLGADFNSQVKQGQVIAQIEATRFKANLDQAEANLMASQATLMRAQVAEKEAKIELDRTEAVAKRELVGAADVDAARAKYGSAQADRAAAEAQISQSHAQVGMARFDYEHTTIRAPISGTVLQRSVDVGQTVAASLQAPVLFTIAQDLSQMEVHAAVDEADVGKLREDQPATFTVDAYPGQTFSARIFQIRSQPTVAQNVVTYDAVLRVDNKDGRLRPGMTATVRAVSAHHDDVLRVPNSALRFRPPPELVEASGEHGGGQRPAGGGAGPGTAMAADGRPGGGGQRPAGGGGPGARVYVPRIGKVASVRFRPGLSDDEYTEILGGQLHEGDEVVIDVSGGSQKGGSGPPSSATRGRGPRFF
jgi:HlyD family secretion protein